MVKCVEFFLGYWLFGVNQRWDGYPGGMGVETWQAPKCRFYHSFLGWWWLLDALSIQNMSFSMQSEHIHLWGFIETFQFNPWLKIWLLDAYDWLLAETNEALEILTVEFCTSCTTESIKRLHSLLLTFALSGWLTTRNFCLGLLQKYCFILGWLTLRFCCDTIFWNYPHKNGFAEFTAPGLVSNAAVFKWVCGRSMCILNHSLF